jgi:hypothetical protein
VCPGEHKKEQKYVRFFTEDFLIWGSQRCHNYTTKVLWVNKINIPRHNEMEKRFYRKKDGTHGLIADNYDCIDQLWSQADEGDRFAYQICEDSKKHLSPNGKLNTISYLKLPSMNKNLTAFCVRCKTFYYMNEVVNVEK